MNTIMIDRFEITNSQNVALVQGQLVISKILVKDKLFRPSAVIFRDLLLVSVRVTLYCTVYCLSRV